MFLPKEKKLVKIWERKINELNNKFIKNIKKKERRKNLGRKRIC